ncbi:aspartyl/asparaginyl beta-hydroxylase domain-containing protein [Sphingomonas sp.]|uniref:aspartyl/asparaginyl beta-hydroxylase domain-containing protein n=1 Tax=Sphingomonas sp. TaxID=28214 RepID=UPI00334232C2
MRRGNLTAARDLLQRAIDGGDVSSEVLFAMAQACRGSGDADGEKANLSKVLSYDSRNIAALLMMAEANVRTADDRGAVAYYRTALAAAATPGMTFPEAILAGLRRGEQFLGETNRRFGEHLIAAVADRGATRRVRETIDLLLGKTELYLQQPSMLYFPGLPQRAFFERAEFDWIPALEAAVPDMQRELAAVLNDDVPFAPYVTGSPNRPIPANPLFNDPSWGAFYLLQEGLPVAGNAEQCPATMAALAKLPLPRIIGRSPMALFSLLRAGTHIRPHHGLLNTRLICHVPLIVPSGCRLRVGGETRVPREGETLIFDDSFEHEAWNDGASTRVVLLFEIWRPELSLDEREHLTQIFEAIDLYDMGDVDRG